VGTHRADRERLHDRQVRRPWPRPGPSPAWTDRRTRPHYRPISYADRTGPASPLKVAECPPAFRVVVLALFAEVTVRE